MTSYDATVKRLKAKLINEEHRLVLMKKIRQSQTRPVNPQQQQQLQQTQQNQQQSAHQQTNNTPQSSQQLSNANPTKKLRPSLLANNNINNNNITNNNNNNNNITQLNNSQLLGHSSLNQTPAHAHQRTKNNTLWNQPSQMRQPTPAGIAPPHVGNLSRNPITTPPNVVQAMMGSLNANQQSLLMNQINALTAAAANSGAAGLLGTPGGSSNRRSGGSNNLLRQPITTPPNVIQDVRGGNVSSGGSANRRAHSGNISSSRQQSLNTTPNVLQDIRGALSNQQQSLLMNANNLLTPPNSGPVGRGRSSQLPLPNMTPPQQQQQQQQSPYNKSQAAQLLVQRRATAKQAVQKQLEQTLIQLPQKHIQPGFDFVPNANNVEFVCYVGLEACVDYLVNAKSPYDTQPLEKPHECSTCGTDFTPSWSWKRSNPVCENCVGNHVKKSIKTSQANRIKSVLTKAAKQEQEIDQKIMAEAANVVTTPSTPTTSSSNTSNSNIQRNSSLLQPAVSQPSNTRNWSRGSQSGSTPTSRSSAPMTPTINTPPATNINLNSSLAALSNLQPAALASLLQMNPQFSTLASLMAGNVPVAAAPPPPPPPPPVTNANNTNQFAQMAALLMNQLGANLWNKR